MLIDREGRFRAYSVNIAVGETGTNKLLTVTIELTLAEEYVDGVWQSVDDGLGIKGWFYLEKKDGDVNEFQIDQLKRAYGWDGRDPFWLEDTDLSRLGLQVDVKKEEYQGQTKFKIAYLHAGDSDPDRKAKKSDENTRRSVNARLGMKLRALAGKSPAPATPTMPAPTPTMPAPATPADEAWEAFKGKCPEDFTDTQMQAEWFSVLSRMFPDKKPDALSGEEWEKFKSECGENITPF